MVQTFDAFGRSHRALKVCEIADIDRGKRANASWQASEHDVSEVLTSVIYLRHARTKAGKIYSIDDTALLEQLVKIGSKITAADLEEKKQ